MKYKTIVFKDEPDVEYKGIYKENKDKITFSIYDVDKNTNILENEPVNDILNI
jgi:hypothetical protein